MCCKVVLPLFFCSFSFSHSHVLISSFSSVEPVKLFGNSGSNSNSSLFSSSRLCNDSIIAVAVVVVSVVVVEELFLKG